MAVYNSSFTGSEIDARLTAVGSEFVASTAYPIGSLTLRNGVLYQKTSGNTTESWNASHWTQVSLTDVGGVDNTLTEANKAADAKVTGDEIGELKSAIDAVAPNVELTWTLKQNINANGVVTSSNYTALSGFIRKCGKTTVFRKMATKDSDNNSLIFYVSQFDADDTFISRRSLPYYGDSITLSDTCTKYAISFGRITSSGVQIQQSDIDNYFDVDIYSEATELRYGYITDTELSAVTEPGCYYIERAVLATVTDLPADCSTNTNCILICLQQRKGYIYQILFVQRDGYLWTRSVSDDSTGNWYEVQNSRYLANVANGDADTITWNGWYGWGSTETVSNVPSTAGMLLNVVRASATKYQLAIDYSTGNVYVRNSKNSVWTDWSRLAFASDVPNNGKTMHIKHESGSFASGAATERLHIYVPAETGYILYLMYHYVDTSNNSDVWQIYNAYQVDDNFDYASKKTLTITGEWECAIHLNGRDDFSGGHTHGDEMMQSVVFLLNGVPVTISDFTALTSCNELRIIRSSTMYDPADHTTAIAEHGVEYVYTSDGVTIEQSLKWLVAETLENCFLCMFLPNKNYIDRAVANNDFVVESLPSEAGTPLTTITKPNSTGVTMWDTASGVFADVAIPVYPTGLSGGDKMTIHDNSNKNYNKVYFYVCTGGSSSVNELWKSKSVYKIDYKASAS